MESDEEEKRKCKKLKITKGKMGNKIVETKQVENE